MASPTPPWSLIVPSDLHQVALARAFIEAVCQVCGLDQKTTAAVVLAAHEAINNIIRHAHLDRPDAQLQVQCFLQPQGLEIHLLDEGAPFDLAAVPHLDPSEIRIGGRGVFLMRTLMDEVSCQPRGEGGNTLRMVKHCLSPVPTRLGAPAPCGWYTVSLPLHRACLPHQSLVETTCVPSSPPRRRREYPACKAFLGRSLACERSLRHQNCLILVRGCDDTKSSMWGSEHLIR